MFTKLDIRNIDAAANLDGDHFRRPFWCSTLFWLTYRLMLATTREPAVLALRMGQKIAIAVMAGLCFNGSIDLTQYGVQALQGALFLIVSENTFSPMYAVLAVFPQAFPLFMREKSSGNYGTVQYYVAHVVAMVGIGGIGKKCNRSSQDPLKRRMHYCRRYSAFIS